MSSSATRKRLSVVIGQVLAAGAFSAHGATITVDDTSGTTGGSGCTIRDAMTAANGDVIVAGCSAGAGPDTIDLPTGATITLDSQDNPGNCLPLVDSEITIAGNGTTIQRDSAGPSCRLFEVSDTGTLAIENAILTGGEKYGGGPPQRGYLGGAGGSVLCDGGELTITGTTISDNAADVGGGIAISDCNLTLVDSTVTGNTATQAGGGIFFYGDSQLYGYQANLTSNVAGIGGGMYLYANYFGNPPPSRSVVEQARSFEPGAAARAQLRGKYGTAVLVDSTVSGNTASGLSPVRGQFNSYSAGGGFFNYGALTYLVETPLQNNSADVFGGGAGTKYGISGFLDSTVSGNTAAIGGGALGAYAYQIFGESTITDNEALLGGGVAHLYGAVGLLKSTVSGNRAVDGSIPGVPPRGNGGGPYGSAGGLYGRYSVLLLEDSTVSGNTAEAEAGAIAWGKYASPLFSGDLRSDGFRSSTRDRAARFEGLRGDKYQSAELLHTTVAFNTAGGGPGGAFAVQFDTTTIVRGGGLIGLRNSILSNPGVGDCTILDGSDPDVTIGTLISDGSCGANVSGDPLLGPLADNGGSTLTHGLFEGSPAEFLGDPAVCADADAQDQAGNPRPDDGTTACSAGSIQGALLGPAVGPTPVPTLTQWAQMLLAALMAGTAWIGLRRRRSPQRRDR